MTGLSVGLTIESVNSSGGRTIDVGIIRTSKSVRMCTFTVFVKPKTIVTKKIKAFLSSKGIIVQP